VKITNNAEILQKNRIYRKFHIGSQCPKQGATGITLSKIRSALTRLREERILIKRGVEYHIDDPLFTYFLARLAPVIK
jgi:hypothetical protein